MKKMDSQLNMFESSEQKPLRRKPNFSNLQYTPQLAALKALEENSASPELIRAIKKDVENHLKSPAGTLENYSGVYGSQVLKLVQEKYHLFPAEDEIKQKKVYAIMEEMTKKFFANEPIKLHNTCIKMIIDYIQNKETTSSAPQYVIVSSPTEDAPLPIQAMPKN